LWEHFLSCLDERDTKSLDDLIGGKKVRVEDVADSDTGHNHISAKEETDELLKKFTERLSQERR
jgi:hypothetical protein